jgi:hypothetical protein
MGRADLERMLLEDEEFRTFLANLREAARTQAEFEAGLDKARRKLHSLIRDLVEKYGIPKAFIARQVGLSPQRINSILKEAAVAVSDEELTAHVKGMHTKLQTKEAGVEARTGR